MPHARPRPRVGAALLLCAALSSWAAAPPRITTPRTAAEADSLVRTPPSNARDKALADWAKNASVNDLAWLLRRRPNELGSADRVLLEAAIARTPASRADLRQRWLARAADVLPRASRKGEPAPPDLSVLRPYASVFRVGLVLPDQGEYGSYGGMLRAALELGLSAGRPEGASAIVVDTLSTGDSDPARVTQALVALGPRCDVIVGELLSAPTLALATGATLAGVTLVSPTATDERVGRAGPRVLQALPGVAQRARALAAEVLGTAAHRVAIAGSANGVRGAFAQAFAAEVESRGGSVVRREVMRTANADIEAMVKALKASSADVLFWDGSARDAETLVRALASDGVAMRLCGGPALSPEAARPSARPLLEGVAWVEDDWRLSAAARARVDTLAAQLGVRAGSLMTRGYLCGARIAAAVDGGARTAGEVAAALRHRDATLAAGGFLEVERAGATLPVFVVRNGRAVPAGAQ